MEDNLRPGSDESQLGRMTKEGNLLSTSSCSWLSGCEGTGKADVRGEGGTGRALSVKNHVMSLGSPRILAQARRL